MKKLLTAAVIAMTVSISASAQSKSSDWTLNTRAWSTNYWTTIIYGALESTIKMSMKGHTTDSLIMERVLPDVDLVFPVGMSKAGFNGANKIYGPYHRAFANPITNIGDYAFGVDASWRPSWLGVYAGAYIKSQEIVFKANDTNLRGFYVQPRAGVVLGGKRHALEAGAFYDAVTDASGSYANVNTDMLKNGWGLDFALSSSNKKETMRAMLQFSMPLHNFLNSKYPGFAGMRRRVGYISLTTRLAL